MTVIDIGAYLLLGALLFVMTRVSGLQRVTVRISGTALPGIVLRSKFNLNARVGLLNTPRLAIGDGIILMGGRNIHTVGMHFPIDVIFLDDMWRIIGWQERVAPGQKKVKGPPATRFIMELGEGTIIQCVPDIKLNITVEVA